MDKKNKRLIDYYIKIMDASGKHYDQAKMEALLERLPKKDADKVIDMSAGLYGAVMGSMVAGPPGAVLGGLVGVATVNKLRTTKRLKEYLERVNKLQQQKADEMEELLEKVGDFDFSSQEYVEINGNRFSYDKGFPIEDYRTELERIGEHEQGDEYAVDIIDGKLVIY